jgi:dTDP-4-dehydrorhamnose reductase
MSSSSHEANGQLGVWGGVECTVNRVRERWLDQIARTGHDDRLEDLNRFAALGLDALRYPVLWERVAPASLQDTNFAWADERLTRLRALGLRPIVGLLHHGSGPRYTSLLDSTFPDQLAQYARLVATRYPWVTDYTPVNEPLTTARFSALYGHWYPHARDPRAFVRALLHQVRAVILAMEAIREINPAARLIQTEDCGFTFGTPATLGQVRHDLDRHWLTFDLLAGIVDRHHTMYGYLRSHGATEAELAFFLERSGAPDIVGLNYYLTSDRYLDDRLERYPEHLHGGNGRMRYADVEAVRVRGDGIAGHESHLIAAWDRYTLPLAITEVHLSCTREEQLRWLTEAWRSAANARRRGVDVRAVTPWALLGSFDWDSLVTEPSGHYEPGVFDLRAPEPRRTRLAAAVVAMAKGRDPDHPVLDGTAWWRRSERLLHDAPPPRTAASIAARCILVTGAYGTLGRAFRRRCALRGLATCTTGRHELDITSADGVDDVLGAVKPWAVINAAGFVRVDEAETQRIECWQSNVVGPAVLAAACARRGLPFVSFSSDLVFDGAAGRPYREDDAVGPINAYGASKAKAESRILALWPDALVIRTSAFFDAHDDANFARQIIDALTSGRDALAPTDAIVSPTYVPDLVDAALDLLIDDEHGIWHLANAGAMTWYAFAQAVAAAVALSPDRLVAARAHQVWHPAKRPANSSLVSTRATIMRPIEQALAAFAGEVYDVLGSRSRTCASS